MKHTHKEGAVCEHSHSHDAEMQSLGMKAQIISEQLDKLDSNLVELEYVKNCLDELKGMKKGSEILSPINSGIFIKATLADTSKLAVNVGKNVVVEKTIEETKELLDGKFEELSKMREELISEMQKIEKRLIELGEH
ncbi:prefoldin subunit alpha [Candidatus Woesearchaeota archaeon]|nr:prefoldin subunit alpha [Candidatus Woesearchaeota archaeon]